VANFTSRSSFTNRLSHFEGEEVFGSTKRLADCPLDANEVSHPLDCVNFSCPRIFVLAFEFDFVEEHTFNNHHMVPMIRYLYYLEVAWS